MRNPVEGTQFRRDVKLAQKRGKDLAKLREAILLLIDGRTLLEYYKDHPLGGDWKLEYTEGLIQTPVAFTTVRARIGNSEDGSVGSGRTTAPVTVPSSSVVRRTTGV